MCVREECIRDSVRLCRMVYDNIDCSEIDAVWEHEMKGQHETFLFFPFSFVTFAGIIPCIRSILVSFAQCNRRTRVDQYLLCEIRIDALYCIPKPQEFKVHSCCSCAIKVHLLTAEYTSRSI